MDKLYPANVTTAQIAEMTEVVKVVKDTKLMKDFIKALVTKPMSISEIVKACDDKYVETNSEDYHFLGQEIQAMCEEIETEWRPKEEVIAAVI
ncbi:hypothetical protein M0R04_12285 [Candidatus Dojkabacteria bacterium]|jgi:hypothetical protein|nr:hypothetical protein [Candidatus Dojkabacteria bacterium]